MDQRTTTQRRGIRMAVQVAALAVGAGGAALAFSAEARADAPATASAEEGREGLKPIQPNGWSCMTPVSRGPAAPPAAACDFDALLAEVPS
ncbi:MAG: hypothetical protein HOV80_23125 [Polyangiaceae bacterium]|nr:hypothetical protein [Polyangiaceae bacterium]